MTDLLQIDPKLSDVRTGAQRIGSPQLDWLIAFAGVWILTGLFIDAHQHLFMAVESFINPWHLTLYSGAVFAAVVLCVTIARNYRAAGSLRKAIPFGYLQSVIGVAALLVGGALDALWHSIFGFEHQLDLLLSPPHLFLLTGLFFLITGPVRSGLARPDARTLLQQLPMLVALGLAFEILQFTTQYGFYPEALMRDHPLSQTQFHSEQFVLSVFLFYRQALEMSIVIWQSVLLAAAVLYLSARKRLCFGALVVICVVEKLWIGGELSTDLTEFLLVVSRFDFGRNRRRHRYGQSATVGSQSQCVPFLGIRSSGGILRRVFCPSRTDVRRHVVGRKLYLRFDHRSGTGRPLRQPALPRRVAARRRHYRMTIGTRRSAASPRAFRAMTRRRYARRYCGMTSSTVWEKSKIPKPKRSATKENDSVRSSTLATFVDVTICPFHTRPT